MEPRTEQQERRAREQAELKSERDRIFRKVQPNRIGTEETGESTPSRSNTDDTGEPAKQLQSSDLMAQRSCF